MAVRSDRIVGPVLIGAVKTTIYTVPNSRTLVVRTVVLYNNGGAADTCHLAINGSGSANRIRTRPINANSDSVMTEWLALEPGDELWGICTTGTNVRAWVFGSLLDGAPL